MLRRLLVSIGVSLAAITPLHAAKSTVLLAEYRFTGTNQAESHPPHAFMGNWNPEAGSVTVSYSGNVMRTESWNAPPFTLNCNENVRLLMTPEDGYTIQIKRIEYDIQRTSQGPTSGSIGYGRFDGECNSFAVVPGLIPVFPAAFRRDVQNCDLISQANIFGTEYNALQLRLHMMGASSTSGAASFDNFQIFGFINDKPVVDLDTDSLGTGASGHFERFSATPVALVSSDATIVDTDIITKISVTLSDTEDGAAEYLSVIPGSVLTVTGNNSQYIEITGTGTTEDFLDVLKTLTYMDSADPVTLGAQVRKVDTRVYDEYGAYRLAHGNVIVYEQNQAPTDISLTGTTVSENTPVNTVVGTLSTTDPNPAQTHTYTVVTAGTPFSISGNQLRTSGPIDYETQNSHLVRIRSTDNGSPTLFYEEDFTVSVTDEFDDADGDGLSDQDEAAGPNGGDANFDSIPDSQQANVASLQVGATTDYVTLVTPGGTNLSALSLTDTLPEAAPQDVSFPVGLLGFRLDNIPTSPVSVTIKLPASASAATTWYKYGPEPSVPGNHWWQFSPNGTTGATFVSATEVTLTIADGGRGDFIIGSPDSAVVDPGGPAIAPPSSVADWMLME